MPEMPSNYNDRALNRDELDEVACEWADYRSAYDIATGDMAVAHSAFIAGWKARHFHGYAAPASPTREENPT